MLKIGGLVAGCNGCDQSDVIHSLLLDSIDIDGWVAHALVPSKIKVGRCKILRRHKALVKGLRFENFSDEFVGDDLAGLNVPGITSEYLRF